MLSFGALCPAPFALQGENVFWGGACFVKLSNATSTRKNAEIYKIEQILKTTLSLLFGFILWLF